MNRVHPIVAATLLLAAAQLVSLGFLCGLIAAGVDGPPTSRVHTLQYRLAGLDLINPLLACEGAEETIGDQLLRPFRDDLAAKVDRLVRSGTISRAAVYFRDLHNGPWHGINEKEKFYPASLLKVPVAMAVLRQAENDRQLLQRTIRFDGGRDLNAPAFIRPRDPVRPGHAYTVGDLLERALAASDNNALGMLGTIVDRGTLEATFRDLVVSYPVDAPVDFLSVRDFATFFRILFNGSYLTRPSSERMLEILSRAEFTKGLRAGVPEGIAVVHKHGEQVLGQEGKVRELHDCGIVYYPDSPYVLCVMTEGSSFEGNAASIREISRMVFSIVDENQRKQDHSRDTARPLDRP